MAALDRKLVRDLLRMRFQVGAIALLIACGVAIAVMAFSAQDALKTAQSSYYRQTRFADVFASAKRAPLSVARDLAQVPGVIAVDARAGKAGLMRIRGLLRPATAILIALPDDPRKALDRLVLMRGRYPGPGRTDEAVALKTFLDAAHVQLGERLTMTVDGRQMSFRIVGAALSPEYVYVPAAASMLPDDAHQGVFWAPRPVVEKATGLGGAFSAVALKLAPGVREPAVLAAVDRALAPYGGLPAVGRADQVSNKFQQDRIERFGVIAWTIPPIFLLVAAALTQMVLGRLVDTEREQIGLLKAFGYGDVRVASTYLKMAALIGLAGSAAGFGFGVWMGAVVTQELAMYMRFPRLDMQVSWTALLVATLISVGAAVAGSLAAVRRAVRISPAIAMRPPAPASFRAGLVEQLAVWRLLDQPSRMIVRNLERFPARAGLTIAGLAVSLSLLVGSQFMFGSFDEILLHAYYRTRHWTDVLGFAESRDLSAIYDVARLPGVVGAEPARFAGVRVRAHGHEEKAYVTGIDADARLSVALDAAGRALPFKGRGLILSGSLARRLRVGAGDFVEMEVTEGRRPRVVLPVTAVSQDYAGLSIYMARGELNRLMGDGDVFSSALLLLAPDRCGDFYRAIERAPQIVGAASRADTIAVYRTTVLKIMTIEMSFFAAFAAAIAFGVAFNVGRIALSDRARDLATLRVLGFGEGECAYILLGELGLLGLVAVPLGVLGGVGLARAMVAAFANQEMQLPMVITAHSYGVATAVYLSAVLVAAIFVGQRIWSLDLVAVLKTRE